jgi:hypothetical protein
MLYVPGIKEQIQAETPNFFLRIAVVAKDTIESYN